MDRGGVVEPKKPWASSNYSFLTLCVSGYVDLDRPLSGGPSGVFLEVKEPLEVVGKLCLLVSRPVRDLVGKVAGNTVPKGQCRGAPEPR
jgi:hypothetical protein